MRPTLHAKPAAETPVAPPAAPEAASPEKHDLVMLAPTPELNPRNRVAAEIAARSNAASDEAAKETMPVGDGENESADVPALTEPPPAEPEAAAPDPEATNPQAPAPEAAQPAAPAAANVINPDADYEVVIDGAKVKIKGSQVLARTQKGEAADYRLELASRLLEEAKRTAATQAQPPAQAGVTQQAPSAPEMSDEDLAQLIQYGSKEQSASAIKALRAQRPDVVTKEELRAFMEQVPRVVDRQRAFHDGLAMAQREYGDLLADPYLKQLFVFKENEARRTGDTRNHVELYKTIGDDLRRHFNRPAPQGATSVVAAPTAQAAVQTIAQKQAAKVAAPAAPKLASVRLSGGESEKKPMTREEIINATRRARGQASL